MKNQLTKPQILELTTEEADECRGWAAMRKKFINQRLEAQRDDTFRETKRGLLELLDKENTLLWKSLNRSPEHCGLLIPMTKWQEIRQALNQLAGGRRWLTSGSK